MEELQLNKDKNETEAKMLEILQKFHESNRIAAGVDEPDIDLNLNLDNGEIDSDDDSDYCDISERLAGVNLDDAEQVWERLTEDEKQDFVAFLKYLI